MGPAGSTSTGVGVEQGRTASEPSRSGFVFPDRLRRGLVVFWMASGLAVTGLASLVHGERAYGVAWAVVAGLYTTPALVLSVLAARRTAPADRTFWRLWAAGLSAAYLVGVAVVLAVLTGLPAFKVAFGVLIGLVAVLWCGAVGYLVAKKSGRRNLAIDVIDAAIALAAGIAPVLVLVVPSMARSGALWLVVPAAATAAAMPAAAAGSAMLYVRIPNRTRLVQWVGIAACLAGAADAWLQVAQGVDRFRLPSPPLLAVQAVSMGLLLMIPLFARRKTGRGLERLAPEEQVRRRSVIPVLVFASVPVLVAETLLLHGRTPWVVPYAVCFLGGLVLVVTARQLVMARETRDLYRALEAEDAERRRLLSNLVHAVDDDRHRMASQLHQLAAGSLGTLGALMQAAFSSLPPESAGILTTALDDVRRDVADRVESFRRLMTAVRPPVLTDQGLASALTASVADLFDTTSGRRPPALTVRSDPDLDLDWTTKTIVHHIVLEAIGNTRRYATVSRVEVTLGIEGDHLVVDIIDDGVHSEAPTTEDDDIFGTIRLFAGLAQGEATFHNPPDGGTAIHVVLGGDPPEPPAAPGTGGRLRVITGGDEDGEASVSGQEHPGGRGLLPAGRPGVSDSDTRRPIGVVRGAGDEDVPET